MTFRAIWTLPEADAAKLTDALTELATADMTEAADGDWLVTAYFEDAPDRRALRDLCREATGKKRAPEIDELADEDWVAKSLSALAPVEAGRFCVHGSHDRGRCLSNRITIEIDAATAFGTGHHGTTAGCLAALSDLAKRRRIRRALDLGCGSGVLAIAIARTWRVPVLATDIDPVAVAIARGNARLNRAAAHVRVFRADGMRHRLLGEAGAFDLVVANILAGPLASLATAIAGALAPGGIAILSGLLPSQRRWIQAAYRNHGLAIRTAAIRDGWLTMTLTKLS